MRSFILFCLCFLSLAAKAVTVGFVVPMVSEAKYLCHTHFHDCKTPVKHQHFEYFHGMLDGQPAVLVRSGIGLDNPAIATEAMINTYHPDLLFLIGSSGGIALQNPGDVVIGKYVFDYDFGEPDHKHLDWPTYPSNEMDELVNPNNNRAEPLVLGTGISKLHQQSLANQTVAFFHKHPHILPVVHGAKPPVVSSGTIADSTVFYTPNWMTEDMKKHHVSVIAFEGISFLRTCWLYQSNCVVIRGLSNALPVSKGNPSSTSSAAGENAALVAKAYLKLYLQKQGS